MFGGVVHHLYVRNPQQRKIHGGDPGRNRIAFDGDHPVETFRKMGRIDAQTAGQIDAERTSVPFFGGDRLAAGLLERQRRQNTAGPVIGREFGPGTL